MTDVREAPPRLADLVARYRRVVIAGMQVSGEEWWPHAGRSSGMWMPFEAYAPLMKIHFAVDHAPGDVPLRIWRLQDGMPGVPPEEYDWSGIRDSSPRAIAEMLVVASLWYRREYGFDAPWPWEAAAAKRSA